MSCGLILSTPMERGLLSHMAFVTDLPDILPGTKTNSPIQLKCRTISPHVDVKWVFIAENSHLARIDIPRWSPSSTPISRLTADSMCTTTPRPRYAHVLLFFQLIPNNSPPPPQDMLVKTKDDRNFEGHCWPGQSSYLDFLHPEGTSDPWKWTLLCIWQLSPSLLGWPVLLRPLLRIHCEPVHLERYERAFSIHWTGNDNAEGTPSQLDRLTYTLG